MNEEIKNPGETTDSVVKEEVVMRHPDTEVLYIGCKDPIAVDLIKATLGEKFRIFVLNKAIFNRVTDDLIKAHVKWTEDQQILEYTKDANRMQECLQICKKVEDKVGSGNWFSLKEFLDETSFTYKHAHSTMDLLFAFGFLAKDEKNNRFMIIADPRIKLKYVESIEADIFKELEIFNKIKEDLRKGISEAEAAIASISTQSPSTDAKESGEAKKQPKKRVSKKKTEQ